MESPHKARKYSLSLYQDLNEYMRLECRHLKPLVVIILVILAILSNAIKCILYITALERQDPSRWLVVEFWSCKLALWGFIAAF